MPQPLVKRGKWTHERERNKNGRWRKKRSDAGKPRHKKGEVQRSLPDSDQGEGDGSNSLSEEVVAAIQRGLRERNLKRDGKTDEENIS